MSKAGLVALIIAALVAIIGVILGAHLYRWEAIVWMVCTAVLAARLLVVDE